MEQEVRSWQYCEAGLKARHDTTPLKNTRKYVHYFPVSTSRFPLRKSEKSFSGLMMNDELKMLVEMEIVAIKIPSRVVGVRMDRVGAIRLKRGWEPYVTHLNCLLFIIHIY